jgi:hypothetical protein
MFSGYSACPNGRSVWHKSVPGGIHETQRLDCVRCIRVAGVAGCATTKEFTATNGSRADGTVTLSYEYGLLESPQEDQEQGTTLASSTCAGWGYSGSQPFGETRQCNAVNGYGSCVHWMVTRRYQCIGSPHDVAPAAQAIAPPQAAPAAPQIPAQATTVTPQIPAQAAASAAPPIPTEQPDVKQGEDWEKQ